MSMHGHPTFPLLQPDVDETDFSTSVIYVHHTPKDAITLAVKYKKDYIEHECMY